ncbi:hypothetical protein AAG570_003165 [Ranatra chinensis]|uniref:RNA helicase n=1 Tax=Ranatra chinensis TaxID=642074 RepID=A0ABD0Y853_9HEMI
MDLDERLLKSIAKLGWVEPTLIQERAIPLLLDGKDVLMRARTGSGKTGAFAIPFIQKILTINEQSDERNIRALILAPSRELCHQLFTNFMQLSPKSVDSIRVVDISPQLDVSAQRPLLQNMPDIVVATPARAVLHLKAGTLSLKSLKFLVIDEADLVFSFGHEENIKEVIKYLPRIYQAALASATLSDDVISLKKLFLHNTVTLRLQEPDIAPVSQLVHYWMPAEEELKATTLYTILKLQLVRGKTIVFVNTVDKCYKLKLFLEQFGLKSCVLNSELPSVIRCHSVSQFNSGVYDIIIASDELALEKPGIVPQSSNTNKKRSDHRKKDKESGVSRGIDFQFVSNVINFDFPLDTNSYVHRVGRTARGVNKGTAISFVSVQEMLLKEAVDEYLMGVFFSKESVFKRFELKTEELEGFRYRTRDAWRSVTKIAVREARLKEIKQEMLNNQKLKGYFEDNPRDMKTLRHDKALHTVRVQPHLANVPDYLIPPSLKRVVDIDKVRPPAKKCKQNAGIKPKYKVRF